MCQECARFAKYGAGSVARQHSHPPISAEMRKAIWERDGGNCRYCGRALLFNEASIDHVLAVTKGGTDDPENLALSCWECNLSKGDRATPNIERHALNRERANRRQWPYEPGDLRREKEIVWLKDSSEMPYVRENHMPFGDRSRRPKYHLWVVAYAVLWPEAPNNPYGGFMRRLWVIQRNDFYESGWPAEGVATSSVIAGQKTMAGRDF